MANSKIGDLPDGAPAQSTDMLPVQRGVTSTLQLRLSNLATLFTSLLNGVVTPGAHKTSHQNGGSDEISVSGLNGVLADPQTPIAHSISHIDGQPDELDIQLLGGYPGLTSTFLRGDGTFVTPPVGLHATSHLEGNSDELDVKSLGGYPGGGTTFLRDDGTFVTPPGGAPAAHATTHQNGGADELSVSGLSGLLADAQTPLAHAASHNEGSADEADIKLLGGYPGGTSTFLRGDATFATPPGGGSGSPGGSDTQVQFNDGGSFGGDSALVWNKTANQLGIGTPATDAKLKVLSPGDSGIPAAWLEYETTNPAHQPTPLQVSAWVPTAQMSDFFGPGILFTARDIDAVDRLLGAVYCLRQGADTTGSLLIQTYIAGTPGTRILVDATGAVTISNLAGVGSAGVQVDASGLLSRATAIQLHASTHQNGGADEISVAGLSGLLADGQTPLAHKVSHQDGGTDELSVAGLSGLLADAQKVTIRKNSGADIGTRKRINLIEGTNVTLTVADDAGGDEVDVTIAAAGGSGSGPTYTYFANAQTITVQGYVDITGSGFAMDANGVYEIEYVVQYQTSASAMGCWFAFNGPASPGPHNLVFGKQGVDAGAAASTDAFDEYIPSGYDNAPNMIVETEQGVDLLLRIRGIFVNGANAGTFILRMSKENVAGTLTISRGFSKYKKVN